MSQEISSLNCPSAGECGVSFERIPRPRQIASNYLVLVQITEDSALSYRFYGIMEMSSGDDIFELMYMFKQSSKWSWTATCTCRARPAARRAPVPWAPPCCWGARWRPPAPAPPSAPGARSASCAAPSASRRPGLWGTNVQLVIRAFRRKNMKHLSTNFFISTN